TAYTSLGQLALAEAAVVAGRARYALLVQSCAATRLIERDEPLSVLLGEGAARVHVGDPHQFHASLLRVPDTCAEAVTAALQRSGHGIADVDFLCVFQGTPWLQR